MAQEMQHKDDHRQQDRSIQHPFPLWVRWFIVLFVLLVVIVGTILWIIQGAQAIIPIAVLTALGILIAFSQVLLWLFPSLKHEYRTASSPATELATKDIKMSESQVDQGEAPQIDQFYDRKQELSELEKWIAIDRCRVVAVLGMGGVGKTSLVAKLTEKIKDEFEYVFWRELKNAPPLETILKSCIQLISNQQQTYFPNRRDDQIFLLIQYLRDHRCLIVLDNVEAVMQAGDRAGKYQKGYDGYGRLIQLLGESRHQSCLLLTSREKPQEVALLEGDKLSVRSYQLEGLSSNDGREILKDKGLEGTENTWEALIDFYIGNPLALKLVAQYIQEVFNGNIANFLKDGQIIFSDIRDVLDQHFDRLSVLEQQIMYWLSIEREAVSFEDIQEDIVDAVSMRDIQETLRSLRRRSLVEMNALGFTLQNVVMEYVTDQLRDKIFEEINKESIELFEKIALIKARTKDYIRESQVRLILKPLAQRLLSTLGQKEIEKKFKSILSTLRETRRQMPGYAAGNILNLLVQLQYDPRSYNFSYLTVWQAYLKGIALPEVNFAHADLARSVFSENFRNILSIAFSSNGELLAAGTSSDEIRVWQVHNGTPLQNWPGHTDWVRSVAFSPDGQLLASGSDDQTVRLWEVKTGQCLMVLQGHTSWVRSVAFSQDGQLLASGSYDQTVRLWEVKTGQCLMVLQGHSGHIWSVAFSPDGQLLASSGNDGMIKLWNTQTAAFLITLISERPYERMNITKVRGLTEAQKDTLKILGAFESEE